MELTIEEALKQAIAAQRDGQTQEADRLYTAILKVIPNHPHANHNLGVLAVSIGRVEEAVPFFHTALKSNPKIDQFWYSYIFALVKLNRFIDARSALEWARNSGAKEEVLEGLAQSLTENVSGKFKNNVESIEDTKSIRASTASTCQDPPTGLLRSLIKAYRAGQIQKALTKSTTLLEAFPRSAVLYNIQGAIYHAMGQTDRSFKA